VPGISTSSVIDASIACIAPGLASVPSTDPNPTGVAVENIPAGPSVNGTEKTTEGCPRYG
jgi:hypothetical protein